MRIIRVFMHPDGDTIMDIGVPDNFNLPAFWNGVKTDGAITAEGAIIPTSVIHHIAVLDVVQAPQFTVYSGGKPN